MVKDYEVLIEFGIKKLDPQPLVLIKYHYIICLMIKLVTLYMLY